MTTHTLPEGVRLSPFQFNTETHEWLRDPADWQGTQPHGVSIEAQYEPAGEWYVLCDLKTEADALAFIGGALALSITEFAETKCWLLSGFSAAQFDASVDFYEWLDNANQCSEEQARIDAANAAPGRQIVIEWSARA